MSLGRPQGLDISGVGLLAGAANVVMQLSLPPVGHGVVESTVESGQLARHPLKRTRTTLSYLAVALLGDDADRQRYRQAVNRSHSAVRSSPDSPVAYNAFDRRLQLWVAACLYVGLEDVHTRLHGPLAPGEAEDLYQRAATLGTTLQVRAADWPPDRVAFDRYWQEGLTAASIDPTVRDHLDAVVTLRHLPPPLPQLLGRGSRFLTIGFLPDVLRAQMGYGWSATDQRRFDRLVGAVFAATRRLPGPLRRFPFNVLLQDVRRRHRRGRPLV